MTFSKPSLLNLYIIGRFCVFVGKILWLPNITPNITELTPCPTIIAKPSHAGGFGIQDLLVILIIRYQQRNMIFIQWSSWKNPILILILMAGHEVGNNDGGRVGQLGVWLVGTFGCCYTVPNAWHLQCGTIHKMLGTCMIGCFAMCILNLLYGSLLLDKYYTITC